MAGMLIVNRDYSKIFIGNNLHQTALFTNAGGAPVTLTIGTVMGRVTATNKVAVCKSASSDGSQLPRFILRDTYTIAAGATATVWICYTGELAKEMLILDGTDTWTTSLGAAVGTMLDVLIALSDFRVTPSTEMTYLDNQ